MCDGIVQVWRCNREAKVQPLFAVHVEDTMPKALNFIHSGRELMVFGYYDGYM